MTLTVTVLQEIEMHRAEQHELEAWLDAHPLCDHSPGALPLACDRCAKNDAWDRINRNLERLLRYGVRA